MANILTFANQTITDAHIFGGISFTHDLNTGKEFSIGNTASASVTFVTDIQLPLYTKDAVNGTFTWTRDGVSRGRYYITEATEQQGKYTVTAYDAMILADTGISALNLSFPLTVSALATAIATYLGCTVSGTVNNGNVSVNSLDENLTIRKLLGYVAEASGCSVKIDGADHLCFMYYADSGITVSASQYKEYGLEVADYVCAPIDNVTIFDAAGEVCATYGSGTNSLFIQGNPLLYEATNAEAQAIYAQVSGFTYAPVRCDMFEENGLEIGTIATFGTTASLVMHIESSEMGAVASSTGVDARAPLIKTVETIATEALNKAQSTNQYFWYMSTGSEAGAHITEIPHEEFLNDPSHGGANLLARANGLAVRDGTTDLATFGANGVVIGQLETGKSRSELSASGMQVVQKDRNANDVQIANLGYGEGLNASGGLSDAPYYSLGVRKANSGIGNYSNAEGYNTEASGYVSHAEGRETTASGYGSHSEGYLNDASGRCAHAEGNNGEASGDYGSHSEGAQCVAGGDYGSHAEGFRTEALGDYGAHAQNYGTKASSRAQTALGTYNVEDSNGDYAVILGNGTGNGSRSNAMTIDWNGNIDIVGEYRVNGTPIGGGGVTGVKGDDESTYRTGNVNIAPADLGEADFVVEQNVSSGWTYRKWNSGIAEMWCTVTTTARTNTSDGGGYVSESAVTPSNFPFTFTDIPNVQCTVNSSAVVGSPTSTAQSSTTSAGSWKLYRNTSNTSTSTKRFNFYVVGNYK